jgi:hypothetical protein
MFARTTSFAGSPDGIDPGIAFVRDEVMPEIMKMAGCAGLSLVADRPAGRLIATSSWESAEARDATMAAMAPFRDRGAQILGAEPTVDNWDVALMHRDHAASDGACCRVTWAETSDVDGLLARFREMVMPSIEAFEGFCSMSMFVDRERGRTCGTTTFDSRAALEASRDQAAENRARAAAMMDVRFTDVMECDLVVHHLRVPELV